jgi:hypothetical protein
MVSEAFEWEGVPRTIALEWEAILFSLVGKQE